MRTSDNLNSNVPNLPVDRLQEDAGDTFRAPGKSNPVAMDTENLALRTCVAQLVNDLAVAYDLIRDLTEINSLLSRMAPDAGPARANGNCGMPTPF